MGQLRLVKKEGRAAADSDSDTSGCVGCSSCPAGKYRTGSCGPDSHEDYTCLDCVDGVNFTDASNMESCTACSTCPSGKRPTTDCTKDTDLDV